MSNASQITQGRLQNDEDDVKHVRQNSHFTALGQA